MTLHSGGKGLCLFPHLEGIGKFLREQVSPLLRLAHLLTAF